MQETICFKRKMCCFLNLFQCKSTCPVQKYMSTKIWEWLLIAWLETCVFSLPTWNINFTNYTFSHHIACFQCNIATTYFFTLHMFSIKDVKPFICGFLVTPNIMSIFCLYHVIKRNWQCLLYSINLYKMHSRKCYKPLANFVTLSCTFSMTRSCILVYCIWYTWHIGSLCLHIRIVTLTQWPRCQLFVINPSLFHLPSGDLLS